MTECIGYLYITHYSVSFSNYYYILYIANLFIWLLMINSLYQLDVLIDDIGYCVLTDVVG